jgi:DNA gyrase subunit A
MIKRTELAAYANKRTGGLEACDVMEDDELLLVRLAGRNTQLMLTSRNGKSVRFEGEQVRPMGRVARGVKGMELKEGDELVSLSVLPQESTGLVLTATSGGYGKRTPQPDYPVQNRGGLGVIDIETGERNGSVVGSVVVEEDDQLMLITNTGRVIRTGVGGIRVVSRNSKGVRLMRLEEGERVVGMTHIPASQAAEPAEPVVVDAPEELEGGPDVLPPEELDGGPDVLPPEE